MTARQGPSCAAEEKCVCQQGAVRWFSNGITTCGGKEEITAASFYCVWNSIYICMDLFHPLACEKLRTASRKMTKKMAHKCNVDLHYTLYLIPLTMLLVVQTHWLKWKEWGFFYMEPVERNVMGWKIYFFDERFRKRKVLGCGARISDELCLEVALGPESQDIAVSAEGIWNISFWMPVAGLPN